MRARDKSNRAIVVLAEGNTERAAKDHIKRFLDERAGSLPKVRLTMNVFNGGLKQAEVHGRAEKILLDPSTVGVIALVDMYPQFKGMTPDDAKALVRSWMPNDPRCFAHVARHDFEAWLLYGWQAILKQSGVTAARRPWSSLPEQVNHDNPPAHRLGALFQEGKPPRKYKKTIDGKKLFEKLDLTAVAAVCPEFKAFLNRLLELASYPSL